MILRSLALVLATTAALTTALDNRTAGRESPSGLELSTELSEAIRNADHDRVATILEEHEDQLDARDRHGDTPLILAARYGDGDLMTTLLERGADVNARNRAGVTALHSAAHDLGKVRALIDAGAEIDARSGLDNTALILAARYVGSAPVVGHLLAQGADVNARNVFGANSLMVAAASGDSETLRVLLKHDAEVNVSPSLAPTSRDGRELPGIFGGGHTPLMWAAAHGDVEAVELLLEHGADPNGTTRMGTPLIAAARRGHEEVARVLLRHGADAGLRVGGADGFTALHWAADSDAGDPKMIELLLEQGVDADALAGETFDNLTGVAQSPLLMAARRGPTSVVETLARHSAEPRVDPWSVRDPGPPGRTLPEGRLPPATLANAIARALLPLERSAIESHREFAAKDRGCVSCHQQFLPLMASAAAKAMGLPRDESVASTVLEAVSQRTARFADIHFEPALHIAPGQGNGLALMTLAAEGRPPSRGTDATVLFLAATQSPEGYWLHPVPRPPLQANAVDATALAVRGLTLYPVPGRPDHLSGTIERARRWLRNVAARSTIDRAFQLLGLSWAGEESERLGPLLTKLLATQRDDGGWAQLPALESDAYATGLVLYALREAAGIAPQRPEIERGLRYLLASQLEDGTWFVRRRAFPFQPTRRSGFPHGRDAWISAAATSWAVLALAGAMETPVTPTIGNSSRGADVERETLADRAGTLPAPASREVRFTTDVRPLLARSCAGCHAGKKVRGGLRIEDREGLLAGGRSGDAAVVPGYSEKSPLVYHVSGLLEDLEMPPLARREEYPGLTKPEIGLLRAWIDQGAVWPEGTALVPREKD